MDSTVVMKMHDGSWHAVWQADTLLAMLWFVHGPLDTT